MKKVFLEVCFWLALICLAVFVNSQTNADSLKTSGPISVHKNGSGTYTVSVF